MKPPATIIVGEVVRLREKLDWFERLPLFGRRIVVTRARDQAASLSGRLRGLGADAIELPTIEIRPAVDHGPLDRAIAGLSFLRLADLHQRQRRTIFHGPAGPLGDATCARCAPGSAPSARPPARRSRRCISKWT